ncbi:MAG: carbohydrate ABC transporter permease [Anaerolineae bacterium]
MVTVKANLAKPPLGKRLSVAKVLGHALIYVVLCILALTWLFPFYWLVTSSLKVDTQLLIYPPVWIPDPVNWVNYSDAVSYFPFFTYIRNSLIIGLLAAAGAVLCNPMVAYGFSRIHWPGRNVLFVITLSTMMLPFAVTMIPVFLIFRRLGLVGTWAPLILPSFLGNAFYIFLLRQFFLGIPNDLSDAARIDGASEVGIFARIIIPLAKPVLATVALFEFMARWRDFLGPLIYLSRDNLYPISIGLQRFMTSHNTEWAMLMAASTLVTLPTLVAFMFTQRTFIEGITFTGIKG